MILDSGILWTCNLDNRAEDGLMPAMTLQKVRRHWFGFRTVGYNRQYMAKGVNEQVDLLVRINYDPTVQIGMYALLGNGEQYRIQNVSMIVDNETNLRFTDLTLQRLERYYDIAE